MKYDWTRIGKYAMKRGNYTIAECFVDGCSMWRCSFNGEIFAHAENDDDAEARCVEHHKMRNSELKPVRKREGSSPSRGTKNCEVR